MVLTQNGLHKIMSAARQSKRCQKTEPYWVEVSFPDSFWYLIESQARDNLLLTVLLNFNKLIKTRVKACHTFFIDILKIILTDKTKVTLKVYWSALKCTAFIDMFHTLYIHNCCRSSDVVCYLLRLYYRRLFIRQYINLQIIFFIRGTEHHTETFQHCTNQ